MNPYTPVDLILDKQQRVYHLKAAKGELAPTVITVGDPGRVAKISRYFDSIEHSIANREFVTQTGYLGRKRVSVVSTGIGTDNIDIVLNEIDTLFNIDLDSRLPVNDPVTLSFIRIGTSGALQPDIPVDSLLASTYAIGLDNLIYYYARTPDASETLLLNAFQEQVTGKYNLPCYVAGADPELLAFLGDQQQQGITLTTPGFFAPQGRQLRARLAFPDLFDSIPQFTLNGQKVWNFEMETAGLYGLAKVLGHRAISFSVILPNRANQAFSGNPEVAIERHIEALLEKIEHLPEAI